MVRDSKARLGRVSDHGSSSGGSSDKERSADKDYQSLSPIGQGESPISDSSEEAIRNLNASAITQAVKDLCSDAKKDHKHTWDRIIDWAESSFFEEVCDCAGINVDTSRDMLKELHDMPLRIRRELVKKRRADAGVRQ